MIDAKPDVILAVRRNRADDGEVDEELRTLKTLCHALPNTEVVVLSHASDDDAMRYLACGANGYLSEPLRPLALRQAIKDVLDAGCALSPLIARRLVNQLRQLALESDCSH